eukprot:TRINITY_DN12803_c0_g1_i1.p1 TRINITY_DN12803_c0_g1~~TRINITY_DN12803_c0_g1_i1.p1  ORF type:complete len:780 (-),score=65.12 TRINITY_DN12803_c0_g1_i1:84-2423(-)
MLPGQAPFEVSPDSRRKSTPAGSRSSAGSRSKSSGAFDEEWLPGMIAGDAQSSTSVPSGDVKADAAASCESSPLGVRAGGPTAAQSASWDTCSVIAQAGDLASPSGSASAPRGYAVTSKFPRLIPKRMSSALTRGSCQVQDATAPEMRSPSARSSAPAGSPKARPAAEDVQLTDARHSAGAHDVGGRAAFGDMLAPRLFEVAGSRSSAGQEGASKRSNNGDGFGPHLLAQRTPSACSTRANTNEMCCARTNESHGSIASTRANAGDLINMLSDRSASMFSDQSVPKTTNMPAWDTMSVCSTRAHAGDLSCQGLQHRSYSGISEGSIASPRFNGPSSFDTMSVCSTRPNIGDLYSPRVSEVPCSRAQPVSYDTLSLCSTRPNAGDHATARHLASQSSQNSLFSDESPCEASASQPFDTMSVCSTRVNIGDPCSPRLQEVFPLRQSPSASSTGGHEGTVIASSSMRPNAGDFGYRRIDSSLSAQSEQGARLVPPAALDTVSVCSLRANNGDNPSKVQPDSSEGSKFTVASSTRANSGDLSRLRMQDRCGSLRSDDSCPHFASASLEMGATSSMRVNAGDADGSRIEENSDNASGSAQPLLTEPDTISACSTRDNSGGTQDRAVDRFSDCISEASCARSGAGGQCPPAFDTMSVCSLRANAGDDGEIAKRPSILSQRSWSSASSNSAAGKHLRSSKSSGRLSASSTRANFGERVSAGAPLGSLAESHASDSRGPRSKLMGMFGRLSRSNSDGGGGVTESFFFSGGQSSFKNRGGYGGASKRP